MRLENLLQLEQEIKTRFRGINAFLIVRRGYLVFERYYSGFGPEDTHLVAFGNQKLYLCPNWHGHRSSLYRRGPAKRVRLFP